MTASSSGLEFRYASIRKGARPPTRRQAQSVPRQLPALPTGYASTDPQSARNAARTRTITQPRPQAPPRGASISLQAKVLLQRLRARIRSLVRAVVLPAIR